MYKYEKIEVSSNDKVFAYIKATSLEDENLWLNIPIDESNSDYQVYLNKDKPKVEQSTPIATDEPATKS